jgi:hypothetical protein
MSQTSLPKISKLQAKHELWRRGELSWKMHSVQKELFQLYKDSGENQIMVWLLSRQTGKSFCLALIACMECITKPNAIVKLLTDTKVHAQTIFEPIFREVLEDCPEDLRPEYNKSSYVYYFPNGSQIQLAGSDGGHAERLRGQKSTLVLIDEAGFCDKLNYNVLSILLPTTTHTGGRIIMASTPPEDPEHEFLEFIEKAEMYNTLIKKTVFDNPLLTKQQIDTIISRFPLGINDPQFRREYLCEILRSEERSVFPELNEEKLQSIVGVWDKPVYYNCYVGMDLGFDDFTAVIFLYYDFMKDKIVVEDEIVIEGKNLKLDSFGETILNKEKELWTNTLTNETIKPDVRCSDINKIVTNEIARHTGYQLYFSVPKGKFDDKGASTNKLRVLLANDKIVIHPRCKTLIRHLKNVQWKKRTSNNSRPEFKRSVDDGHYDTVDALIYAVNSITTTKNPYPAGYNVNMQNLYVYDQDKFEHKNGNYQTNNIQVLKRLFNRK